MSDCKKPIETMKNVQERLKYQCTSTERIREKQQQNSCSIQPIQNSACCRPHVTKQANTNLLRGSSSSSDCDPNPSRYFSSKSEYIKYQMEQYKKNSATNRYSTKLSNDVYHKQGAATASEKIQKLKFENSKCEKYSKCKTSF